jgi:hypothetical protein
MEGSVEMDSGKKNIAIERCATQQDASIQS